MREQLTHLCHLRWQSNSSPYRGYSKAGPFGPGVSLNFDTGIFLFIVFTLCFRFLRFSEKFLPQIKIRRCGNVCKIGAKRRFFQVTVGNSERSFPSDCGKGVGNARRFPCLSHMSVRHGISTTPSVRGTVKRMNTPPRACDTTGTGEHALRYRKRDNPAAMTSLRGLSGTPSDRLPHI